ncbi:hypothetical protein Aperf_G00000067966 [Anoplocephala perfoliata]
MSLALLVSRHLVRRATCANFASVNVCRTLMCSANNKAKMGTTPQPVTSGFLPSYHWTTERILAISMLPLYPVALIYEPYGFDHLVAIAVCLHAYWGVETVLRDYVMERRYGPLLPKVSQVLWKIICLCGFAGFTYFNYYDIGIIKALKKLWSV